MTHVLYLIWWCQKQWAHQKGVLSTNKVRKGQIQGHRNKGAIVWQYSVYDTVLHIMPYMVGN